MTVASTLVIPELTLPFPNYTHPAVREIDDATVAWLHDFGLLADPKQEQYVRKIGLGRWFPSLLPDGPTERVLLGAQLTAWYTVLDDQVAEKHGMQGDTSQLMRHLVHSEDVARLPDDREETSPLQRALQDITRRIRAVATPEQAIRLQWHSLQYYLGIASEAAYTARGAIPAVVDYQRIRRLNSCIPPFFVMSELCRGLRLPLAALLRPEVQRLTALAVDLTTVVNDIIGLPRDLERDDPWLLSRALAHHQGLTVSESLDFMVAQYHRDVAEFVALSDQLRASDTEVMRHYVDILRDLVAGHLAWTRDSPRYKISGWV